MIEKLLLKLHVRDSLSAEEDAALSGLIDQVEEVPAKKVVIARGAPLRHSILLLDGLMCRFKDLKNGRRQISALHVPGDFLDLHGFTLKHLDHDVMALTKSRIALVPHERLTQMTVDFPHLTRLMWFSTNLDAAVHREWEVSLGQRSGIERVAHLFCEMYTRMSVVGLVDGQTFDLPMSQSELGECLGLTPVHTNRVLRNLRERGLAEMKARQVIIHDMAGLKTLAEFDPIYLYLDRTSR